MTRPAWVRLPDRACGCRACGWTKSLTLSWDQDAPFQVDLTGRRPAFRIYAEAQKSGRDEVLPMTPDFAQWLLQTPEAERVGRVFKLMAEHVQQADGTREVGRIVVPDRQEGRRGGQQGRWQVCHRP